MRRTIALTIDVEHDCPPYLRTYRGIEYGLPELLSILEKYGVSATFFVTGDVASKYPRQVKEIAQDHEVGCHGLSHERFDRMNCKEAVHEIEKSTDLLCRVTGQEKIASFRAPNLAFPERFTGILRDNRYLIDSSLARYKIGHLYRIYATGEKDLNNGLLRIPVSATSSVLRLPFGNEMLRRLSSPAVLFFHPWEFVEMHNVRWDCRINTGRRALLNFEAFIEASEKERCRFCTMSDFLVK